MAVPTEPEVLSLLELYRQTHEEIKRYRDFEWKVLGYTVALLAAIAALTRIATIDPVHEPYIKTLLFILTAVSAIYGSWHIHFIHKWLTWNRNFRRKLEDKLGFYDSGPYGPEPLLPFKGQTVSYWKDKGHLSCWWGLISLVAAYALYSIVYM